MAKKDWCDRLFDLHALMLSTKFPDERETCYQKIIRLLNKHGKTMHDVPELLVIVSKRRAPPSRHPTSPPPTPPGDPITGRDLFYGIRAMFEEYLSLEPHEYPVCALWCMHSHLSAKFMHTPRLVLRSPVRECGKTTLLDVVAALVPYPYKSENMTAAVFFRVTDRGDTLLLDEVDNLGLLTNAAFRAALNAGHRRGGTIDRVIEGKVVKFRTFAPTVLAGIGTVPLPLARRSIIIKMKRDPHAAINRRKFNSEDDEQCENFSLIKSHLAAWAHNSKIVLQPPMPEQLTAGQADNWRPLIAVGDACAPEIGELARDVAVQMCRDLDEDLEVLLLRDIRDLFDQKREDRLASAVIVEHLNLLPHGLWSDWRGKHDTDTPRPMTAATMAKLLSPFGIRPVTIWPPHRTADSKSAKGYHRYQFEAIWASYCPESDTPAQSSKIKMLRDQ